MRNPRTSPPVLIATIAMAVQLVGATPVSAQTDTFACDPGFYQVISGQLAQLDTSSGDYQTIGVDQTNYNAIGYRIKDGYLYGIRGKSLVQITANGVVSTVATLNVPSGAYAGDFGDDGLLHVSRGGRDWHAIDVDAGVATPQPALSEYTATADITNIHGIFYGISSDGTLIRIDPVAGVVTTVGEVSGLPSSLMSYGAAWSTAGGNLYIGRNSGEVFQITGYSTATPVATLVATAPATNSNDGASCALASKPAGIADVDGPKSETEPSTPEAKAAAEQYEATYEPEPIIEPANESEPEMTPGSEDPPAEETYTIEDAGFGTGATCQAGGKVDRPSRDTMSLRAPVAAPTVLYSTTFTAGALDDYTILSGAWNVEDDSLLQDHDCGYDYAALLTDHVLNDFIWTATFEAANGSSNHGGVVVNQSSPHTRSGATLVDFADGGATLRWGSYDTLGYYQPIGSMPSPSTASGPVTLSLEVHGTSVAVEVNGLFAATFDAPEAGGHVALESSQTAVRFTAAELIAVPVSS